MKQYDAIIIGFGKAGKTLAAELSNRGWQVAVGGTFKHDVWRNVSQHRLYPDENARARSRHCRLALSR